jgi:hypothetical protein
MIVDPAQSPGLARARLADDARRARQRFLPHGSERPGRRRSDVMRPKVVLAALAAGALVLAGCEDDGEVPATLEEGPTEARPTGGPEAASAVGEVATTG